MVVALVLTAFMGDNCISCRCMLCGEGGCGDDGGGGGGGGVGDGDDSVLHPSFVLTSPKIRHFRAICHIHTCTVLRSHGEKNVLW